MDFLIVILMNSHEQDILETFRIKYLVCLRYLKPYPDVYVKSFVFWPKSTLNKF